MRTSIEAADVEVGVGAPHALKDPCHQCCLPNTLPKRRKETREKSEEWKKKVAGQ